MSGREDVSRQRRGNELSALLSDTKPWPEESLGSRRAEANESRGMDQGDLGVEPRPAGGDLSRVRLGVNPPLAARLPLEVLHRVGDVGLTPIDTDFLRSPIDQLSGRPDQRPATQAPDVARLLSAEHDPRVSLAFAEHGQGIT